ncbi:MAG: AMP-binding protein [Actinobacteria bacterium]|nr:AMP-binding protein [Actinomycetota bacterium]
MGPTDHLSPSGSVSTSSLDRSHLNEPADLPPGTGRLAVLFTHDGASNVTLAREIVHRWRLGDAVCVLDGRTPTGRLKPLLTRLGPHEIFSQGFWRQSTLARTYPSRVVAVVVTSGTTGDPKAVVLSRASLRAAVTMTMAVTGRADWYCCLPLHHVAGLSIVARTWLCGTDLKIDDAFDARRCLSGGDNRWVSLVATQATRVLAEGSISGWNGLLLGASAIPHELLQAASAQTRTHATYGMTETWGGVIYDGYPLPDVAMRLGDGRDESRIEIRTPTLMDGYLEDPDRTTAAIRDGWFLTDDIGRITNARLEVLGRNDDVIVTGGVNVSPDKVEQALARIDEITDVGVIGIPDELWGQRVVAYIPADQMSLGIEELRARLSPHLLPAELPRELRAWPGPLPRTPGGKLRRAVLRADSQAVR